MENWNKKELAQKIHKGYIEGQKTAKGQTTAKSKKKIRATKAEVFKAKDLDIGQLGAFFTSRIRKTFTELRQVFVKAPILNHFDLECYIRIKTDVSGYTMGEIFSQLILDDLGS